MKTIFETELRASKHTTESLFYTIVLVSAFFMGVPGRDDVLATDTYSFSVVGSGPFTVTGISPTVVEDNQAFTFTSAMPFSLTSGVVQGFDNLTIPTFPDRFFNGSFDWTGPGGNEVFGTLTVQTSVFTDPVDESFSGTFQITGGSGQYLGATGGGTYDCQSNYFSSPSSGPPPFSGSTTVTGTGTITVPEPSAGALAIAGVMFLVANRRRSRKVGGSMERDSTTVVSDER